MAPWVSCLCVWWRIRICIIVESVQREAGVPLLLSGYLYGSLQYSGLIGRSKSQSRRPARVESGGLSGTPADHSIHPQERMAARAIRRSRMAHMGAGRAIPALSQRPYGCTARPPARGPHLPRQPSRKPAPSARRRGATLCLRPMSPPPRTRSATMEVRAM